MPFSPLAALAAGFVAFLVGGLWYSPILFGARWQALEGLDDEQLTQGTGRIMGLAFLFELVIAVNLAAFIGPAPGVAWAATAGALAGFGWVWTGLAVTYLFARKPWIHIAIDGGYHAVTFTLMGVVIGLLQ